MRDGERRVVRCRALERDLGSGAHLRLSAGLGRFTHSKNAQRTIPLGKMLSTQLSVSKNVFWTAVSQSFPRIALHGGSLDA